MLENSTNFCKVLWHIRKLTLHYNINTRHYLTQGRYVNGTAHLGHAFTLSKVEFVSRVARAEGKRTLYPQGYHGTGMPIKACADKLVHEMKMFGQNFEGYNETDNANEIQIPAPVQETTKEDVTKFTNVSKGRTKTCMMRFKI